MKAPMKLKQRNVEWARQRLEPGIQTLFGYMLKRNLEFGIESNVADPEEVYAVLRQTMGKAEIERMLRCEITFKEQRQKGKSVVKGK